MHRPCTLIALLFFLYPLFGQQNLLFQGSVYQVYPLEYSGANYQGLETEDDFEIPPATDNLPDGNYVYLYSVFYRNISRSRHMTEDTPDLRPEVFATFSILNKKTEGPVKFYSDAKNHCEKIKLLLFECNYQNGLKQGAARLYKYTHFGARNDVSYLQYDKGFLEGQFERINAHNEVVETGRYSGSNPSGIWQSRCKHGIHREDYRSYYFYDSLYLPNNKINDSALEVLRVKLHVQDLSSHYHADLEEDALDSCIVVIAGFHSDTMENKYGYRKYRLYEKRTQRLIVEVSNETTVNNHDNIQNLVSLYPTDFLPLLKKYRSQIRQWLNSSSRVTYFNAKTGTYAKADFKKLSAPVPLRTMRMKWKDFKDYYYPNQSLQAHFWDDSTVNITIQTGQQFTKQTVNIKAMAGKILLMEHASIYNNGSFQPCFEKSLLDPDSGQTANDASGYLLVYKNLLQKMANPATDIFYDSVVVVKGKKRNTQKNLVLRVYHNFSNDVVSSYLCSSSELEGLKAIGIKNPVIEKKDKVLRLHHFRQVGEIHKINFTFLDTQTVSLSEVASGFHDRFRDEESEPNKNVLPDFRTKGNKVRRFFRNAIPFSGSLEIVTLDSVTTRTFKDKTGNIIGMESDTQPEMDILRFRMPMGSTSVYPFENGYLQGNVKIVNAQKNLSFFMQQGKMEGPYVVTYDTAFWDKALSMNYPGRYLLKLLFGESIDVNKVSAADSALLVSILIKSFNQNKRPHKPGVYRHEANYSNNQLNGVSNYFLNTEKGESIQTVVHYKNDVPDGPMNLRYASLYNRNGIPDGKVYFYDSTGLNKSDSLFVLWPYISGKIKVDGSEKLNLQGKQIEIRNNSIRNKNLQFFTSGKLAHSIATDTTYPFTMIESRNSTVTVAYDDFSYEEQVVPVLKCADLSNFQRRSYDNRPDYRNLTEFNPLTMRQPFTGIYAGSLEYHPGMHRWYYPNGKPALEGKVNDKVRLAGDWQYYYQNGAPMYKTNYDHLCMDYYITCSPQLVTVYDTSGKYYGKINIEKMEFDGSCESHQLMPDGEFSILDWPKTKKFRLYHENGVVKTEGEVNAQGWKHGVWKKYNRSGLPVEVGQYLNNKKDGRWISGDLSTYANLDNLCFLDSQMLVYTTRNLHFSIQFYKQGRLVSSSNFENYKPEGDSLRINRRKNRQENDSFYRVISGIIKKYQNIQSDSCSNVLYHSYPPGIPREQVDQVQYDWYPFSNRREMDDADRAMPAPGWFSPDERKK